MILHKEVTLYKEWIFRKDFEDRKIRARRGGELSSLVSQLQRLAEGAICIEQMISATTPEHGGSVSSIHLWDHVLIYHNCNQFGYTTKIAHAETTNDDIAAELLERYKGFYGSEPEFNKL